VSISQAVRRESGVTTDSQRKTRHSKPRDEPIESRAVTDSASLPNRAILLVDAAQLRICRLWEPVPKHCPL